jgi:hypothetical protein
MCTADAAPLYDATQAIDFLLSTQAHPTMPSSMQPAQSLDELSVKRKLVIGLCTVALGLLLAGLMMLNPERLRVPMWVALCACAAFVVAGVMISIQHVASLGVYRWLVVLLLAVLVCIPAWIAFGPGSRYCASNIPFLTADFGCRIAFGIAALIALGMLVVALRDALRG